MGKIVVDDRFLQGFRDFKTSGKQTVEYHSSFQVRPSGSVTEAISCFREKNIANIVFNKIPKSSQETNFRHFFSHHDNARLTQRVARLSFLLNRESDCSHICLIHLIWHLVTSFCLEK